jgi:4-hydroxybenzoate polyprenyltransferase
LIIALAQYFTAVFIVDSATILDYHLFLLSFSTVLIAAAGYIINDYYDVKIDFINKPERVEIGKTITRRFAILFHVSLSVMGIMIGLYLSWMIGAVNAFSVFLLWLYSNNLKRLPFIGNFSVALLTGVSIFIVEILYPGNHAMILVYSVLAFFMTLVREIVKDMEDLKGDNTFGCRTLPIVFGIRKTKWIIYAILFVFVLSILWIDLYHDKLPEYYFLIFLLLPLLILIYRLSRADTKSEFNRISTFCKLILLLGILSMAFL